MQSSVQQKILSSSFPSQVFSPEVEDLLFCLLQCSLCLRKPESKCWVWAWAPSVVPSVPKVVDKLCWEPSCSLWHNPDPLNLPLHLVPGQRDLVGMLVALCRGKLEQVVGTG